MQVVSGSLFLTLFAILLTLTSANLSAKGLARLGFPLPQGFRIGQVDSLRGYLALSVLCHHFILWPYEKAAQNWIEPQEAFVNQLGAGAVGLFFMATGLVFYPVILKGIINNNWASLYIRRIFRIVPMLTFSIIIVTAIIMYKYDKSLNIHYVVEFLYWVSGKANQNILGYSGSRFVNLGVLWSIWYEWVFYFLILPACCFLREFCGPRTWLVPLGLGALALIGKFTDFDLFRYLPLFVVGMAAYEIQSREIIASRLRSPFAAAIAVVLLVIGGTYFRDPYGMALPLFAFFFVCVACGNTFFGFLGNPATFVLGECSFGIYVLHGILIYVGSDLVPFQNYQIIAMPVLGATIAFLAAGTYLLIEAPGMRCGRILGNMAVAATPSYWRLGASSLLLLMPGRAKLSER